MLNRCGFSHSAVTIPVTLTKSYVFCDKLQAMQKVLTAAQMREVDRLTTEEYGIPSILLMENAAHAVARVITEKLGGSVKGRRILILCGKGNNGGDGAALARILAIQGAFVDVLLLGTIDELSGYARINFDNLAKIAVGDMGTAHFGWYSENSGGTIALNTCLDLETWQGGEIGEIRKNADVVVDAILGTGVTRELDGIYFHVAQSVAWEIEDRLNEKPLILALDLPSGLNADVCYPIGVNVQADITVTFTAPKPANVLPGAAHFGGKLVVADIGSPAQLLDELDCQLEVVQADDLESWFWDYRFRDDSYKNKRGHGLLIAGSESYSGAAVLAGDAAMRSGVGLVTVVTPKSLKDLVASRILPEVMVRGVAETVNGAISEEAFDEIEDLLVKADSVAIGCGLSRDESTKRFVEDVVFTRHHPVIVDADALNLLSPFDGFAANGESQYPLILTPHEGEFMRLLGTDDKEVIRDRVAAVREFAVRHNVILVLKGERVLIGEPGGKVVVNPTGNSGLGKAGNGDTLTGILAGFVAQASVMNIDIFETVVAAVYVAGMAGDIAEKKYGKRVMTASDVRECLSEVFEGFKDER